MNSQELQTFLNIIDNRIKKHIGENKLLKQYCGVVEEKVQESPSKYKVRLLGDPTIFTFLNKTGEVLSKGDYVYVQTVGTDLTTGVVMYKTKESAIPDDFVVAQGTSENGWIFRKWHSGFAECWTTLTYNTKVEQQYGNIYTSSSSPLAIINYPFEFIERPLEYCSCNTGSASVMAYLANNTTTQTGNYIVWRGSPNANLNDYQISISVVGKWK